MPWGLCFAASTFLSQMGPHPVIATIKDNDDYLRAFLYSYYSTIEYYNVKTKKYNFKGFLGGASLFVIDPCFETRPV